MINYSSLEVLYPEKNKKTIFLFELFLEKINNPDQKSLKNKDLNPLRIVKEFFLKADFDLVEEITTTHVVSGNYYQHRHDLFLVWRDTQGKYSDIARLLCMLFCGEINLHEGTTVVEVAKNVYMNVNISDKLYTKIDKVKIFNVVAEVWDLFMGYDNSGIRNISLGCEQYVLPDMRQAEVIEEVVAYHNELSIQDLGVGLADSILVSWCDGDNSLNNLVLLATQPLYSKAMHEDGLIGSFVAKQDMGKSLFSDILRNVYPKVGNFSHKALSDKGYLFQDLMAGIITDGKDFAVFQETDGIGASAMSALKPLVTYTDRVSARRFQGTSFEASYHGSIILTSNYVNDLAMTGDIAKRLVNIKFKYSELVKQQARWLMTDEGALSVLVACLLRRAKMMRAGYKTAFELKSNVQVNITDSVADISSVRMLKELFDEKGYATGRELGSIFDNPRGKDLEAVVRNYGLERFRRTNGVAYRVDTSSDVFGTVLAHACQRDIEPFAVTRYSLNQVHNDDVIFDPDKDESILLDLNSSDYQAWLADSQLFKQRSSMRYIVSESNSIVTKDDAVSFNRLIIDYDKFDEMETFEVVKARVQAELGSCWFALWETPRSAFGDLRVRLMVLLREDLPVVHWSNVVKQLDKIIGVKSDQTNSVVHKQGLALPWLKYYVNKQHEAWRPELNRDIEQVDLKPVEFKFAGVKTERPKDFEAFTEVFINHLAEMGDKVDDYDFWMRTYLLPLSRYVVYDKSITHEEAKQLIQLTTDNFGEKMSNVKLLNNAIGRGAGLNMYEDYNNSIEEFYMTLDYSPNGFEF